MKHAACREPVGEYFEATGASPQESTPVPAGTTFGKFWAIQTMGPQALSWRRARGQMFFPQPERRFGPGDSSSGEIFRCRYLDEVACRPPMLKSDSNVRRFLRSSPEQQVVVLGRRRTSADNRADRRGRNDPKTAGQKGNRRIQRDRVSSNQEAIQVDISGV